MALSKRVARASATIILSGTMAISQVAPAQAFFFLLDPDVRDRIEFFMMCKELMLTDPPQHVKICNPKRNVIRTDPYDGIDGSGDHVQPAAPSTPTTTTTTTTDSCSSGCSEEEAR
jgi:hypothetical protein